MDFPNEILLPILEQVPCRQVIRNVCWRWHDMFRMRIEKVSTIAAGLGYTDILHWLRTNSSKPFPHKVHVAAAKAGRCAAFMYLARELKPNRSTHALKVACMRGHLHIFKSMLLEYNKNNRPKQWDELCNYFAYYGDIELLKAACPYGNYKHYLTSVALQWAAAGGHIHVMEWLDKSIDSIHFYDRGLDLDVYAAKYGRLHVIEWLYTKRSYRKINNRKVEEVAASRNHVHVLQWIKDHDIQFWPGFSCNACNAAAKYGHLEALIWLRANDYHWDEQTLGLAIYRSQVHIVRWMLNNGYPKNRRLLIEDVD